MSRRITGAGGGLNDLNRGRAPTIGMELGDREDQLFNSLLTKYGLSKEGLEGYITATCVKRGSLRVLREIGLHPQIRDSIGYQREDEYAPRGDPEPITEIEPQVEPAAVEPAGDPAGDPADDPAALVDT